MIKWEGDGFRLEIEETRFDGHRKYFKFKLWDNDELIFDDDEYSPSPMHNCNTEFIVADLLAWLSLQDDDVDEEYWERHDYTDRQIEWRDSDRCMDLKLTAILLEEEAIANMN